MRQIISLICFLLPVLVFVAEPMALAAEPENRSDIRMDIRSDAPDRHIVVKGDTLWDISSKFFKDPWKWPTIWGFNKDLIKDPHWIYPGDAIFLDRNNGILRIAQADASAEKSMDNTGSAKVVGAASDAHTVNGVDRLSPKVRDFPSTHDAIQSIPGNAIAPFLNRPLVIEEGALQDAPALIGAREGRVILGNDDTAFAKGLPRDKGEKWQIYRPGKTFVDPYTNEVLGIEAVYLGNAEVTRFADVSTVAITHSIQEIYAGDRLVVPSIENVASY